VRQRKSIQTIIQLLAKEGPLTPYSIAKKTRLSESVVHDDIKDERWGLERQNIVKVHRESEYKGRKRREYILSFKGVVAYLDFAFRARLIRPEIKKFIEKSSAFYHDYPLFTKHEFLAQWLGNRIYDWYDSAAWCLKEHPPHAYVITKRVRGPLLSFIKPSERKLPKGAVGIALESKKEGEKKILIYLDSRTSLSPEDEDEIWMHGYALSFLNMITAPCGKEIRRMPNEALYKFFKETIDREKNSLNGRLKAFKNLEAGLKKALSSGEK